MKFPSSLKEWNFEIIKNLVEKNYSETEIFDFKSNLQPSIKQERIVCAFANTSGGFLIFGVGDTKKTDRIIGIPSKVDFQKKFYDKIRMIEPSVYFEFKQPAIRIPHSDKVIHVCYIPRSSDRPHITRDKLFYIRTNGGSNELMNYSVLRESFHSFEQRKIKIELLGLELIFLGKTSQRMVISEKELGKKYSLYEPSTSVLIDLMGQVYPVIKNDKKLIHTLFSIRSDIETLNLSRKSLLSQSANILLQSSSIERYNKIVNMHIESLNKFLSEAYDILNRKFGFEVPKEWLQSK